MSRRVSFRPEAEAEALETRDWYEGRRPGLGAEFRAALDATIERLAASATGPGFESRTGIPTRRGDSSLVAVLDALARTASIPHVQTTRFPPLAAFTR